MLTIDDSERGRLRLSGRFDAAQVAKAEPAFRQIQSSWIIDLEGLEYISSAGLGILLEAQKRLRDAGESLRLVNLNPHVKNVFLYAGFDHIFEIE